ncbi:ELMO domain-containing protein 3-like [Stylophora pistillata]|uniref:ELMO domain-containing protein 3 n=1 Tax=Stylophora pistillata TaxID=50429 RepID=A0A2B4SI28_STYPI|nr:ELMO domain-containing protein 3-like [Stylophora pistillata]PFX29036.1 ELMO domain-containing protein 3 [Stylophora pistillata]
MASLKNRKATPDDLEAEAEKAFQRAAAQQNRTEDDEFDLEFESVFQNFPPNRADAKSDGAIKESTVKQEVSNGPSQLPVKTEGLPSSLPSSQGSSVSELNRYSPRKETTNDSEKESGSISPTSDQMRPGKRRRRSDKDNIPPGIRKLPSPPTTLEQAQMEWDLVETVQPGNGQAGSRSPLVTFQDAIHHFQTASYLEQHMSHIKPTVKHRGMAAVTHRLFGPPKMNNSLHSERNLIFALALCMFKNDETMHTQVLQTIYKKLTGTKLDCPRYGNHWELIGFQGLDPATDLRGCGFLGLLTTLYLVTEQRTHALALDIYKLSQHETQNFPFSIMSINITRIALQTLREEKLNKECNRRRQVLNVFVEFYAAIFIHVYQVWKHQHKTISESGFVLREAEKLAKKRPRELHRNLERALADRQGLVKVDEDNVSPKAKQSDILDKFAGVCDLQVDEEEEVHLV